MSIERKRPFVTGYQLAHGLPLVAACGIAGGWFGLAVGGSFVLAMYCVAYWWLP